MTRTGKRFDPASDGSQSAGRVFRKGHYTTMVPETAETDEAVEVVVDDIAVVERPDQEDEAGWSKYAMRPLGAAEHVADDEVAGQTTGAAPEGPPAVPEWRSDARRDGSHYRRVDSRRSEVS